MQEIAAESTAFTNIELNCSSRVHDKDNIYFIEYKTRKTEFRKRKRRAERRWREEKYADVSEAAELDIGNSS
jgi:hypothetical protein